jgi:enoyl-[acyl-carrier protein] reductase I
MAAACPALAARERIAYTCDLREMGEGRRMSTGLLAGKRGLIMGLANDKSIAWGIAKACAEQGADLAFSYQGEALKKRVEPLMASIGATVLYECDVANEATLDGLFQHLKDEWGSLDFVVHAIGFSDKNELRGRYVDTSAANFRMTMDISVYSFTAVCQRACAMMGPGGSLLTLTYYGAEKVMPHYNVMGVAKAALEASVKYLAEDLGRDGIRVNAISAGPIKTLAASGIGDFRYIMKWNELNSPLRRNVTQEEVGKAALYLLSDLGSGTTGENLHVDAGYHVVGMKAVDSPDIDAVTGRFGAEK